MERCDFASITAVLRKHLMEGSFKNQVCFVNTLFESYIREMDADFDHGLLNKWLNGLAKVSVPIGQFYHDSQEHRLELADTLRDSVFSRMADSSMAVREVHALLLRDTSVSDRVKADMCYRLCGDNVEVTDEGDFLADVLVFGIVRRPFVPRDIRKASPAPEDVQSPIVCVQSSRDGPALCSYQYGQSQDADTYYNVFVDRELAQTSQCDSMMRLAWSVARLQNHYDFRRGIAVLCEAEEVLGGRGSHAALTALRSILQAMSCLRSSGDRLDPVLVERRASYVYSLMQENCPDVAVRGGIEAWREYAESKCSRGPPLRMCQAVSHHHNTHRASSVERRVSCAPRSCMLI